MSLFGLICPILEELDHYNILSSVKDFVFFIIIFRYYISCYNNIVFPVSANFDLSLYSFFGDMRSKSQTLLQAAEDQNCDSAQNRLASWAS